MSRPTEGFSAMTSVLPMAGHVSEGRPRSFHGREYSPRVADLLHRRRAEPARRPLPVSAAGTRARAPAGARRVRARRQPHLELRPVAARALALPATLAALHGEVGALLVAARPRARRGGR